ncbi:hypothetical protein [Paracoccus sediminicola]|uniref:hypothetical protein n=1 Tax=Paracoccus sediminicola TaxID=3017783 RepID=UPI0022F1347F|nr:hypothetical protein [Paracoccus sediminicola]WBU57562.1 hypothetical protein PAF18_03735 [Paracoccus sediminicola]
MIVIACAIIGFALGWHRAGKAGGNRKDRWQWAIAHLMIFSLLGLFATLVIERLA